MKKRKIKDFLSETKVRITSFIKENKYLSLGILAFAIIGVIVGFAVFADNEPTADVTSMTVKSSGINKIVDEEDPQNIAYTANSFSDITFNVSYILGSQRTNQSEDEDNESGNANVPVTIIAKFSEDIDAYWLDNNDNYSYIFKEGTNKKEVEIELFGKSNNSNTAILELRLENILGDLDNPDNLKNINPEIIIKAGTNKYCKYKFSDGEEAACEEYGSQEENNQSSEDEKGIYIIGSPIKLEPFLVKGYPYKKDSTHSEFGGRYIPFGIILGVKQGDCEGCVSSLEGKYINPQQKFTVMSYPSSYETPSPYYDYDNSTGLFEISPNNKISGMPNYIYDPEVLSVIDSGTLNPNPSEIPLISSSGKNVVFDIRNIKASVDSPIINVNNQSIIAFGSYYTTYKVPSSESDVTTRSLVINANDQSLYSYIDIVNKAGDQYGTELIKTKLEADEIKVNSDSNVNYNSEATLSYGEEAKVNVEYSYGIDGDIDGNKTISVLISSSDQANSKIKIADDSSSSPDAPINVEINGKLVENPNPNIKYYKYNDTSNDTSPTCDKEINISEKSTVLQQINSANVCKITYSNDSIKPGSKINIFFKVKSEDTKVTNNYGISAFSNTYSADKNSSVKVKTVAYKARTKIYYSIPAQEEDEDYVEYDIVEKPKTVYGNEESKATIVIYPSLTAPGLLINNNALGSVKKITNYVRIELPEQVNYVPNENYSNQPNSFALASSLNAVNGFWELPGEEMDPKNVRDEKFENKKILFYEYVVSQIDEYMEPIKIDISFDNMIPDNTTLEIDSRIYSSYITELGDTISVIPSSDSGAASFGNIRYKITSSVLSSLVAPQTISKSVSNEPSSFDITASVANRTGNSLSNVDLIVDTPTPENYSGSIMYNFNDESVLCSTSIEAEDWSECSTDKGNDIRRIKYHIDSLNSNEDITKKITVSTFGNESSDEYSFVLSVILNDTDEKVSKKYVKVKVNSPSISGTVWQDFSKNGYFDSNEKKLDDVELHLFKAKTNSNGKIIESEYIDSTYPTNGKYVFNVSDDEASYYIVPEFDENKYGLTTYHGEVSDITKMSSFKLYEEENLDFNVNINSTLTENIGDDNEEDEIVDSEDDENNDEEQETDDEDEQGEEQGTDDEEENEYKPSSSKIRSDIIYINSNRKSVQNINLGLTLKEVFKIKMDKYITSAITTNSIGISSTKSFGNVNFAKFDVKNINSLSIKVIYTIKVKNTGFYPGYIKKITDIIPDGMVFNDSYSENAGWTKTSGSDIIIEYTGLNGTPLLEGEEKYITLALDLVSKTAGEYVNEAIIGDEDLILYQHEIDTDSEVE